MEDIIANIDDIRFDIEVALEEQLGIQPLPFPGMDKSGSAICDFYISNRCTRGQLCPLRHVRGNQMVVCKHWLRGLCKKGDDCEFLHKYDMERMPECYFFIKYGQCSNKECPFLHLNPADRIKDCPWYDRGFCKHGPHCKNRHVRRVMCVNYMCGFCPEGNKCKLSHPRFEIQLVEERKPFAHIVCHACGEQGHKSTHCAVARRLAAEAAMRGEPIPEFPPEAGSVPSSVPDAAAINTVPYQQPVPINPPGIPREKEIPMQVNSMVKPVAPHNNTTGAAFVPFGKRPLEFVTCFKCRGKGHYANRCPFSAAQRPPAGIPNTLLQSTPLNQQNTVLNPAVNGQLNQTESQQLSTDILSQPSQVTTQVNQQQYNHVQAAQQFIQQPINQYQGQLAQFNQHSHFNMQPAQQYTEPPSTQFDNPGLSEEHSQQPQPQPA